MKTALVTGSKGFIGSHLVERLNKENVDVIEIDLPDTDVRREIKIDKDIDLIFHLACLLKVDDFSKLYETNVIGTKNVVNLALNKKAKLIFSSTYVYGNPNKLPVDEDAELIPHMPYTKSKIEAEKIIQKNKVNYIILRQFNVYGPRQEGNLLVPMILKQVKRTNGKMILLGSSKPKRDFLYVDDLVDAMLLAAKYLENNENVKEIFNIGYGKSYSVKEIVNLIQIIAGTKKEVFYDEYKKDIVMDCYADTNKAKRVLGWVPKIDIKEGLRRTMSNY